jgi:hypothetical protein
LNSHRIRLPRFVAAKALIVSLLSIPAPWAWLAEPGHAWQRQATSRADTLDIALDPAETARLLEVADWVNIPPQEKEGGVVLAVREKNGSFDLFRELPGDQIREVVLKDIPFGQEILRAAASHDVDPLLVAAVVEVESTFRPRARSHKGATGLMQLLPSTAGMPAFRLVDPRTNLNAGSAYLSEMLERFDGDLELALAAYNAGPTNVRRHGGVPPFRETQNYVDKVLTLYVDHHRTAWQRSGFSDLVAIASRA